MGREPVTQTMNASEAHQRFSHLLDQVSRREARILVEESGIPVAAIVSADDLARLDRYERERAERFGILDEIGSAFNDVPPEEIEEEVARALAEVRAEARQDKQQGDAST